MLRQNFRWAIYLSLQLFLDRYLTDEDFKPPNFLSLAVICSSVAAREICGAFSDNKARAAYRRPLSSPPLIALECSVPYAEMPLFYGSPPPSPLAAARLRAARVAVCSSAPSEIMVSVGAGSP